MSEFLIGVGCLLIYLLSINMMSHIRIQNVGYSVKGSDKKNSLWKKGNAIACLIAVYVGKLSSNVFADRIKEYDTLSQYTYRV